MRSVFFATSGFYAFLCADDPAHERAIDLFHRAERESWDLSTHLSQTDCVNFAFMAERGIRDAIAFNAHFARQGFALP